MSVDAHGVLRLQPVSTAPAEARRAVRSAGATHVATTVTDTAELLASELVTNAITHGAGLVTIAIECEDGTLAVAVSDDDPAFPVVQPEQLFAVRGRGLRMVDSMASAWGVAARAEGPGKVVWFRVS